MGKGVGKIGNWFFDAKAGSILLEISYIDALLAKKALSSASKKLPLSTLILSRVKSKNSKFNYEVSRFI
jgi:ribosomal protein L16/L10AE